MKRKIAVILAADVAGYSRLVAASEEQALRRLVACRSVFERHVDAGDGRIFSTAGDAVLAEFPSAVEALRCALAIQADVEADNAGIDADSQMRFRMGLTVGDVVERDGDLLGDGVNVAARLEGLAAPGGVCVSRALVEQVGNRLPVRFEEIGVQTLKNIPYPVQAYRVAAEVAAAAGAARRQSRANATTGSSAHVVARPQGTARAQRGMASAPTSTARWALPLAAASIAVLAVLAWSRLVPAPSSPGMGLPAASAGNVVPEAKTVTAAPNPALPAPVHAERPAAATAPAPSPSASAVSAKPETKSEPNLTAAVSAPTPVAATPPPAVVPPAVATPPVAPPPVAPEVKATALPQTVAPTIPATTSQPAAPPPSAVAGPAPPAASAAPLAPPTPAASKPPTPPRQAAAEREVALDRKAVARRCSEILELVQLGEPLSPEDRTHLAKHCR